MSYLYSQEQEVKNTVGTPLDVNVTNPLSVSLTNEVVIYEKSGLMYHVNNAAIALHRGFTVADVMVPVLSIRMKDGLTVNDIAYIEEYQIANNNSNTSTVAYVWYEGTPIITGPTVDAWSTLGVKTEYRFYTDWYSSQIGNNISTGSSVIRHGGLVVGRNAGSEEASVPMFGGNSQNMLTLCMQRLDASGKLDLWVSLNVKEII